MIYSTDTPLYGILLRTNHLSDIAHTSPYNIVLPTKQRYNIAQTLRYDIAQTPVYDIAQTLLYDMAQTLQYDMTLLYDTPQAPINA